MKDCVVRLFLVFVAIAKNKHHKDWGGQRNDNTVKMWKNKDNQGSSQLEERTCLIKWTDMQSVEIARHPYGMIEVINGGSSVKQNVYVESRVIVEAYSRGIEWKEEMCQKYSFVGTMEVGSIVCEQCLPPARYTVFSCLDNAYTKTIHAHDKRLAICLYCKKRVKARPVKGCNRMPEGCICVRENQ